MFLRRAKFFDDEVEASLRNLDHGFLKPETIDSVFEQVKEWPSILNVDPEPFKNWDEGLTIDAEKDRIYMRDAERTFKGEAQRETLIKILSYTGTKQGEYHQGEGLVAGLLLLTFDEPTVLAMLHVLNTNSKYLPGFWRSEAVACATEGYVLDHLLRTRQPEVADHLLMVGALPETYCSKWMCGLCINLLPFKALYQFFDQFFKVGHPFLIQFGITLIETLKDALVETKETHTVMALLRLDRDTLGKKDLCKAAFYDKLVEDAQKLDLSNIGGVTVAVDNEGFQNLRKGMYDLKLKARLERANQVAEDDSDSEIVFSDESSEEDPAERLARLAMEGQAAAEGKKGDAGVDEITKGVANM